MFTFQYVLFAYTIAKLSPVVLIVATMAYFKKSRNFFFAGLCLVFTGPAVHFISGTTWLPTYLPSNLTLRVNGGDPFPTYMVESWQGIALIGVVLLSCKKVQKGKECSNLNWQTTLPSLMAIWMVVYVAYEILLVWMHRVTAFYCLVVVTAACFYVSKVVDQSKPEKLQFSLSEVAYLFLTIAILLTVFSSYRDSLHLYLTTPVSPNNIWNKGFWGA